MGVKLSLEPKDGRLGALEACSGLTALVLGCSQLQQPSSSLSVLSKLGSLQHLGLVSLTDNSTDECGVPSALALPTGLLPSLKQLSRLWIVDVVSSDQHLQELSCLAALQELGWASQGSSITSTGLQALTCLQAKLTQLELCMEGSIISIITVPALAQLTGLLHLVLVCSELQPGVLSAITWLQHLELVLHSEDWPHSCQMDQPAVLAWLAQLPNLRHLQLGTLPQAQCLTTAASAAASSALVANSQLEFLGVTFDSVPAGAWQHVFTAGRQLPRLHPLKLTACTCTPEREAFTTSELQLAAAA